MKPHLLNRPLTVLFLVGGLLFVGTACDDADPPANAEAMAEQADQETVLLEERRAFRDQMEADLDAVKRDIAAIEAQAGAEADDLRSQTDKVREKLGALYQELTELDTVGDSTYRDVRPVLERRYEELVDELEGVHLQTAETYEAFQAEAQDQLQTLNRQLATLEEKAEHIEAEIVVGDSIRYGELRADYDDLVRQLDVAETASAEEVQQQRKAFIEALTRLKGELRSAMRRTEMGLSG